MPVKTVVPDQTQAVRKQVSTPVDTQEQAVVHPLVEATNQMTSKKVLLIIPLLIISLGVGTGYVLANMRSNNGGLLNQKATGAVGQNEKVKGKEVVEAGWQDNEVFSDDAKGLLEKNDGSITKEGSHRLIREGGPSQTVYLTSSVLDLSKFEGKQVEVKGETNTSRSAGWLMDVGWIKEIE